MYFLDFWMLLILHWKYQTFTDNAESTYLKALIGNIFLLETDRLHLILISFGILLEEVVGKPANLWYLRRETSIIVVTQMAA